MHLEWKGNRSKKKRSRCVIETTTMTMTTPHCWIATSKESSFNLESKDFEARSTCSVSDCESWNNYFVTTKYIVCSYNVFHNDIYRLLIVLCESVICVKRIETSEGRKDTIETCVLNWWCVSGENFVYFCVGRKTRKPLYWRRSEKAACRSSVYRGKGDRRSLKM